MPAPSQPPLTAIPPGLTEIPPRLTEINDATIRMLVDGFYARVRQDPVLAPVFAAAIAESAWPEHLRKMYAF